MAKRFGRNQRRKQQEDAASAERVLRAVKHSYHALDRENQDLKSRLRRSIEIDIDVLRDNSRATYEARMSAHKMGYEGLHLAQRIDARELALQREQDRFIEQVATHMARALARTIGGKW